MKSIVSYLGMGLIYQLYIGISLGNQSFFLLKSIVSFQKWVQPLQRRLQSVHEAHRAGLQPREAREIRPNEVKLQTRVKVSKSVIQ